MADIDLREGPASHRSRGLVGQRKDESETALVVSTKNSTQRFSALLQGSESLVQPEDRPLFASQDWVVAPTLGAIVPNWLIIVPRKFALNFRNWNKENSGEPLAIVGSLCEHIGLEADEVIWFEHGPIDNGTLVGCGTDYAHLHVIFRPKFSFDELITQAKAMSQLKWTECSADVCYPSLPERTSYLICGSGSAAAWASNVESTGSQFFRKVVASLSERSESWNYKQFAHRQNILKTIEAFRRLEGEVRRVA